MSDKPPKSHFSQARTALLVADALLRKSAQEKEVPVEVVSKLSDQLLQMRLDMRQYLGNK